jgi:predicted PurR-regulated permease PerM
LVVFQRGWGPLVLILIGVGIIARLVWPFFSGLVLALVLATLVRPWHLRTILPRFKGRVGLAAGATTALLVVLILLPLAGLAFLVGAEAANALAFFTNGQGVATTTAGAENTIARLAMKVGVDPRTVAAFVTQQGRHVAELVVARIIGFLTGIPGLLLQLGVALFVLFYLLRDGDQFMITIRRMIPLDPDRREEVLGRATEITEAMVYGTVVVAVVQGILGGIIFRLLGLPAATLWGTMMGVLALIPMVGPPLIWIPTSIYLVLTGSVVRGLILFAVGALVIGTVDNLLRAVFVSGRTEMHSLVVFLSVLGGVFAFGAPGIVVGPVLFVLGLIAIDMGRLAMEEARAKAVVVTPPS